MAAKKKGLLSQTKAVFPSWFNFRKKSLSNPPFGKPPKLKKGKQKAKENKE
jgi:hypothetical protein